jgi:hypothetical protein
MTRRDHTMLGLLMVLGASAVTPEAGAGDWHAAASTNVTREYPGLALLPDGKVLAVTGHPLAGESAGQMVSVASAELYDPQRDVWTPTGNLSVPRNGVQHGGLIKLPNGKYLIAGGGSANRSVHEVELYDYGTGTWTMTGAMHAPRCVHTITQLASGDVLAAGGIDWLTEEVRASAEVYDHATGKWTTTGAMANPRFSHRAVKLSDGRVLVTGGHSAYPGRNQDPGQRRDLRPAQRHVA